MTSRERVIATIERKDIDRVPIDLGGSAVASILAKPYHGLLKLLNIDKPVHIADCMQMWVYVDEEVSERFNTDVVSLWPLRDFLGVRRDMGFKDWVTPIGTPVKISKDFNLERMEDGSYIYGVGGYIYRLPSEGFYFDTVKYAYDWVETAEDVQKIEYPVMSEMEKGWIKENAPRLRRETDKFITTDIVGGWCDIAGPMLGNAKFYMDMISNKPMIHALFKKLNEVWMKWIDDLVESAGDSIDAVIMYNDLEHELAFGSPEQVREQAKRHTQIFKDGGGFVFTQPHNIQSNVPPENVLALYEAGNEFGKY